MKKNRVTATLKARKKVTHLDFGSTVGDCNIKNFGMFKYLQFNKKNHPQMGSIKNTDYEKVFPFRTITFIRKCFHINRSYDNERV